LRSGLKALKVYLEILTREDPDLVQIHITRLFLSPIIMKAIHRRKPTVRFIHHVELICFGDTKIFPSLNQPCDRPMGWCCLTQGCIPPVPLGVGSRIALIKLWERRVTKYLDSVIVGSHYMYQELLRNGFSSQKVVVIPLYTEKGSTPNEPLSGDLILYVGHLDQFKGLPQFLRALHLLQSPWRAEIIGDGPAQEEIMALANSLNLEPRVRFLGRVPAGALDEHYRRCALVVMPSMSQESFGLVGIEAMAFGKPVVAFDVGGVREWLVDGETGFLVKRGDVRGLADRIEQLLLDMSLADRLGQAGRQRVDRLFRKHAHMQRLVNLYQELIDMRQFRPPRA
jgi:glycosyltransferase involved in cell wall biosynthesis